MTTTTTKPEDEGHKKLWIGNLDTRVTEYQLLKIIQIHGTIEKFDLIFHRSGPLAGQPRGYAFVTYMKSQDAMNAKNILNGKLVGQKCLSVTWAHSADCDPVTQSKPKPDVIIPALALAKDTKRSDRITQIQAIEAKLKLMEHKDDELKINDSIASKPPVIQQFQYNKNKLSAVKVKQSYRTLKHKTPYVRKKHNN